MKFSLTIQLGNDAMQTGEDVARALRILATRIDGPFSEWVPESDQGIVYDENGNSVGTWGVTL